MDNVEVEAMNANGGRSRNVPRLIVDKHNLIRRKTESIDGEAVRTWIRLENSSMGSIDENVDLICERDGQRPVLSVEKFKLVRQDTEFETGLLHIRYQCKDFRPQDDVGWQFVMFPAKIPYAPIFTDQTADFAGPLVPIITFG